ncbi:MAG: CCA tRNA nucleotidyltransferase [Phycisphaerales bacterium]
MGRSADPARARTAAIEVVRRLRDAGFVAYFAGGCVRDELLGLRPTDYDVATDARPDAIRSMFERTHLVGLAFGVLLVHLHDCQIEVATFRADGPYTDLRRPDSIEFSDATSDASRRDFTINALFLDPLGKPDGADVRDRVSGHVIDLVGGIDDLHARRIRAVGNPDQRLAEDHLRALRAVRFAARLGFEIEPSTADAIRRHAMQLKGVSRERIGEEIRRMMEHPRRAHAAAILESLGLDAPVFDDPPDGSTPGTSALDILAGLEAVRSEFVRHRLRYGTVLAAWCIDRIRSGRLQVDHNPWELGPRAAAARGSLVARLRRALCLSNDERDDLADGLEGLGVLLDAWDSRPVAGQKRIVARRWFKDSLRLALVLDPVTGESIVARVRELARTPTGLTPDPWVTGDDLIAMGMTPGPLFRSVLDRVLDAQLEGRVRSKDEAVVLARELSGDPSV